MYSVKCAVFHCQLADCIIFCCLAVRLRMLESEERGRAKAASGRDELAEENHRKK